ncbi:TetR/AcrR family transcriptional regulator [Streptomyces sp. AN091965]|uniref:TetR/AcrR family transcriptional regulator n=1 Tax=Streptomyces sp. AN091965 TaxID=2927803 RepID=UPI001F61B278|nr:TetR/AcrR family transcriptional regulator [Streptomyces sp. AN091965]MCI3935024.1 TetR/AcrR family transcriptional regulator [Streptomyces sp. AN091965]
MNEPERPAPSPTAQAENAASENAGTTDRRLLRGSRTRRAVARHAVDVASLDGLNGLSIGRLATDLGLSKSGVATLFGSKEKLQLAAVGAAREAFVDAVVRPAADAPHGADRLRALLDRWLVYASAPLFTGGCFWAANRPDFDSRPGPVHDALFSHHREWLTLLADELRHAVGAGEVPALDAELTAFQIDAVLTATNTALRVGDPDAAHRARLVVEGLLSPRG